MPDPLITKQDEKILKKAEKIIETAEQNYEIKSNSLKARWFVIPIFSIIFILFIFSTIFAILNQNSNLIVKGVHIKGIDISGLTKEQASEKVTQAFIEALGADLILTHNDQEISLSPADIYASFAIDEAVDLAYNIGRTGNIFQQNFEILSALSYRYDISPAFSYSAELLDEKLTQIEQSFSDYVVQPSYTVDGTELKIQNGKTGVIIDRSTLVNQIVHILNNLKNNQQSVEIPTTEVTPNPINLDTIYQEVRKDPVDAYYTTDPFAVYPSSTGIDFSISMEEAKAMLSEPKEEYIIPLKVVYPNVTTNDLGSEAFPDLLATYTTTFNTGNTNRSTNIRLSTQKINGVVLMPGETFSYNQVVGQRTLANGFKVAAVYSNGEVSEGVGGGICQVSSTLYNAILLSNLEVTERRNHTFHTGYVPAGQDATVSWGAPDFKFKNNRNYPIRIIATVTGGKITTKIYGLKQADDYTVKITSSIISTIPYKTTYKTDSSLEPGKTKVIQEGSNGFKSVTYKILYQNGKEVSREVISRDTYQPHNQIIARGN